MDTEYEDQAQFKMESEFDDQSKTNLIVNYLPQNLADNEFSNFFSAVGLLKSAKIIRNKSTGYSYGFGFVEYVHPQDAQRAIDTLNGTQIQSKKIKVAYARPSGDNIKNANVYIRGIPKHMSEEDLKKVFNQCGNIIQCRILKDEITGQRKGTGFILFDLKEQADLAISKYNGQTLPGSHETLNLKIAEDNARKVKNLVSATSSYSQYNPFRTVPGGPIRQIGYQRNVRYNPLMSNFTYSPTSSSVNNGTGDSGHILFVYNIGPDCDEKSLWHLFGQYGTVLKVNVIRDATTGMGKGYGFVTMTSYDDAQWAIDALNGFAYSGKPLQVSFKSSNK